MFGSVYNLAIFVFLCGVPLLAHAAELTALSLRDRGLQEIPGPHKQIPAWNANNPATTIHLPLSNTLAGKGSLMFWINLDRVYAAGPSAESYKQNLIHLPGVVDIVFNATPSQVAIETRWQKEGGGQQYNALVLPGLPQGWIHLAYRWDTTKGWVEPFVDASPIRPTGAEYKPWKPSATADQIELTPGRFALADVRLSNDWFTEADIRQAVGPIYRGSLDHLLGLRDRGRLDLEPFKGSLIYENPLNKPQDIANWRTEGSSAIVSIDDKGLRLSTKPSTAPEQHMVIWCDQPFPSDFVAQWTTQMVDTQALLIVFFSALGKNGQDIFDPSLQKRDGIFPRYHSGDIDCYHISYYAFDRATSHIRKNAGFFLVENGPIGIPSQSKAEHQVMLMKNGSRIVFTVDGRLLIDFLDDGKTYGKLLGGGKLGFRQMNGATALYRNLKVYQVKKESAP